MLAIITALEPTDAYARHEHSYKLIGTLIEFNPTKLFPCPENKEFFSGSAININNPRIESHLYFYGFQYQTIYRK